MNMLLIIERYYYLLFLMLCSYQVLAILIGLDFQITSTIIVYMFLVAVMIIINKMIENKFLRAFPRYLLMYVFLIVILLFCYIYYSIFLREMFDSSERSSVVFVTSFIKGILTWIVLGSAFYFSINKMKAYNKFLVLISLLLFLVFTVLNNGISEIDYLSLKGNDLNRANHLSMGTFAIYLIFFTQSLSKGFLIYLIFVLNILVLYMIGGRSDILIYIGSCFIFYTFFDRNKSFILYFSLLAFSVLIISRLTYIIGFLDFKFLEGITIIFSGNDPSEEARVEFLFNNIQDLPNKILIGNPNYFIEEYNSLGTYTHNIISIWEFFGLLPFILVLIIIFINVKYIINNRVKVISSNSGRFAIFSLVFVILEIILAKSAFYYPFWFSLGFLFMLISFCKNKKV